jgi:hypothetical protein
VRSGFLKDPELDLVRWSVTGTAGVDGFSSLCSPLKPEVSPSDTPRTPSGGAGFVAKNILVVAVPQYDVPYVLLPMFLAWCYWVLWLLIKGIDRAQWDAKRTAQATAES